MLNPQHAVKQAIRVNQAGEYGAKRIYDGQLAILGRTLAGAKIRHMAAQEQGHLDAFNTLLHQRGVRPTILQPLWHVAGFALGAGTALLGERWAMACTAVIEEVIEQHYKDQAATLGDDAPLQAAIASACADEVEHRSEALASGAASVPLYGLFRAVLGTACRGAIAAAKRW
ncbi:MAG: demethoxyubiquinone hydroxylase family protein [Holosporales bacterium]|jgi:ubiquinone biosynthesis monooxygenase Coq7